MGNIASWKGIYSLFGESVLDKRQMFFFACDERKHLEWVTKYIRQGYSVMPKADWRKRGEFSGDRVIGDSHTRFYEFSWLSDDEDDIRNVPLRFICSRDER